MKIGLRKQEENKETEMNDIVKRKTKLDMVLLPIIKNLAAKGLTEADIGMIIGYTGRNPGKFLTELSEKYPDVAIALQVGKNLADTELVTTAFETAIGYRYVEETKEYKYVDVEDADGNVTGREKVLVKSKRTPKIQRADASVLKMLLMSRLPDQFTDTKKAQDIDPLIDGDSTEAELLRFAGAIMKIAKNTKEVKSEVIDAE